MPAHPKPSAIKRKVAAPKKTARTPRAPKATPAPVNAKKPPVKIPVAAKGQSKTDMLIAMMQRPEGATSKQMEGATGWAPHSVRGLLGTLRKRAGFGVVGSKAPGEATVYRVTRSASEVGDVV